MQGMPHHYKASANAGPEGLIPLNSPGLQELDTDAPAEFGGSGDYWSPETLLVGAVANCFILTFRALSRRTTVKWSDLTVDVEGTLDKTEQGLRFTGFLITARLQADEADQDEVESLLEQSKKHCLITASLTGTCELRIEARA